MLCYRCGSHVPDSAERCGACGQRQVGTARMPSTTGVRRRLSPALLAGAPYRIGDRMAERYVVKDAIGLGPLGYVFRATDEQQGIDVAVKMIHPRFVQTQEEREAFARAVEPARKFLQPSLARVHDLGVDQGWPYVTYSFLDGLTLRRMIDSRLAKGQTFTVEEVEPFLGQLAAALEAAHPLGAHADLKPENVIILPDMLRVVDWGLARGLPRLPFVQAQRQKGAHRYLAPEMVAGADADPRADLYALGVLVGEMLTGLTPEEDLPELRLTSPELSEAVEGFYRRALNERPEARFRSVRELYDEFLALLSPPVSSGAPVADGAALPEVPAEVIEEVEPIAEPEPVAASPAPTLTADAPAPAAADTGARAPEPVPAPLEPAQGVAPIPAAELPRFDGQGSEPPRHASREVVALEPPAWGGPSSPAEPPAASGAEGRWRSLRLWDAGESPPGEPTEAVPKAVEVEPPAAAEATGPVLPLSARGMLVADPADAGPLEPSEDEAERAVAGLTEIDPPAGLSEAADEPLLADALGVDLVIDGDEPVPASPAEAPPDAPRSLPPPAAPLREAPRPAALADTVLREPPPPAPELPRPWSTGPRPAPFRREVSEAPRTREAPVLHPRPVPAASLGEVPAAAARSAPPPPPSIPPLLSAAPRLDPGAEPGTDERAPAPAPTPLTLVPEPSPTRQEPVVGAPAAVALPAPGSGGRAAGAWSPAELLAQVIAEIRAEERGAGDLQPSSWEPVPLDATQPISSEEVAARVAAEGRARGSVAGPESEDHPALRHAAGRAGMRMALFIAVGLILGMLGGWTFLKVLMPAPRPEAQRLSSQSQSTEQPPAPRN